MNEEFPEPSFGKRPDNLGDRERDAVEEVAVELEPGLEEADELFE